MTSKLSVDLVESNSLKTFRLMDNSFYNSQLIPKTGVLEITAPGFSVATRFIVKPYFNMVFNSSILNIVKVKKYSDLPDLPDGLYSLKYSINPNDELWVEYNYFRVQKLLTKYALALCGFLDKKCDMSSHDYNKKKLEYLWIRELIEGAKYKAEECDSPEQAIELYNEANHLLDKILDCC